MAVVPHGVIRVLVHGSWQTFLVHQFHWAPVITVIDARGQYWTIPARNYVQATPDEQKQFWLTFEQTLHNNHVARVRYERPNNSQN